MMIRLLFICLLALTLPLTEGAVQAQALTPQNAPRDAATVPQELQDIGIQEKLGNRVPGALHFTNDRGEAVTLADYFKRGKPIILTLAYYECPMLCTLVLNGVS